MAGEESRKRTRGSQQPSSGAPEPSLDPVPNPLGDHDLTTLRKRIDTLAKAQELRDPIRRFAGESQSRIEQDLLMLQRGIGSKEILRRWAIYKKLVKLRKARKAQRLWPAQEAELQALQQAARDAIAEARIARADELMQQVRDFGRYPKASKHVASRERRLAQNLREARKEKLLSPEQESELQVLQQAEMDSRAAARISEAQRPLDPMERFAGESQARRKEYRAAYYQKNKARLVVKKKEYIQKNKARIVVKQKEYYQKNKARIVARQKEYDASPHGKAKRKEYFATPHGKARRKEYKAAYYQKNKARIVVKNKEYYQNNKARLVAEQKEYNATPQGKTKRKEYRSSPHGKAKRKDWDAKRRATPHRMATLHGKETTSGRPRAEGGELPHCQKRKALRTNVVRGV